MQCMHNFTRNKYVNRTNEKFACFFTMSSTHQRIPLSHLADIFHHRYSINVGKRNKSNNGIVQDVVGSVIFDTETSRCSRNTDRE